MMAQPSFTKNMMSLELYQCAIQNVLINPNERETGPSRRMENSTVLLRLTNKASANRNAFVFMKRSIPEYGHTKGYFIWSILGKKLMVFDQSSSSSLSR